MTDSDEVKLLPWSFEARLSSDGLAWEVVDVTNAADPILVAVFDSKGAADDFHEENAKIAAAALNARQFGLTRPPVVTDEVVERLALALGAALKRRCGDRAWADEKRCVAEDTILAEVDGEIDLLDLARAAIASMPAVVSGGQG